MIKYILTVILLAGCSAVVEPDPTPVEGHTTPPSAAPAAPGQAFELPPGCQWVLIEKGTPKAILCSGATFPDRGDPAPFPTLGDPAPEKYLGP